MTIKDNAIVLRGGVVTEGSLREAATKRTIHIGHDDVVTGLSVQVWNDNDTSFRHKQTLLKLLAPVPNEAFALARAKDITKAGGEIRWQKLKDNPYHAVVDGLRVDQIVEIFSRNQYRELWGEVA